MTTRAEQLAYCKVCTNRSFDLQKGVVCKLTGEHADFIDSCPDFTLDTQQQGKLQEEAKEKRKAGVGPGGLAFRASIVLYIIAGITLVNGFLLTVDSPIILALDVRFAFLLHYAAIESGATGFLIVAYAIILFSSVASAVLAYLSNLEKRWALVLAAVLYFIDLPVALLSASVIGIIWHAAAIIAFLMAYQELGKAKRKAIFNTSKELDGVLDS